MGFTKDQGYLPVTIDTIMAALMDEINNQFGTDYTAETFIGSNFYKYFYAAAQRLQESEIKTSEIFAKLQDYFDITNERIQRPVVTPPGLIENFLAEEWVASVKPMIDADAGKISVCVDVDDAGDNYDAEKIEICTIIKDSVAAGVVSQGTEIETLVLSNGQPFDFKFLLPDREEVLLQLTITLSDNNQVVILSPEEVKEILMDNIASKYQLGKDFEPQRYFSVVDAPWAAEVLLEWSDDAGANWHPEVFEAAFDDLFVILLENITVIEA
jgi:hypothetical protein